MVNYISIPYGSIKRKWNRTTKRSVVTFQFLMVQLKDLYTRVRLVEVFTFQFLMVQLKVTWKRRMFVLASAFQFLMVQLKEPVRVSTAHRFLISIPYGSIKSYVWGENKRWILRFQFLMVQLKAESWGRWWTIKTFQFLMVQLKVSGEENWNEYTRNFNSLWFN